MNQRPLAGGGEISTGFVTGACCSGLALFTASFPAGVGDVGDTPRHPVPCTAITSSPPERPWSSAPADARESQGEGDAGREQKKDAAIEVEIGNGASAVVFQAPYTGSLCFLDSPGCCQDMGTLVGGGSGVSVEM